MWVKVKSSGGCSWVQLEKLNRNVESYLSFIKMRPTIHPKCHKNIVSPFCPILFFLFKSRNTAIDSLATWTTHDSQNIELSLTEEHDIGFRLHQQRRLLLLLFVSPYDKKHRDHPFSVYELGLKKKKSSFNFSKTFPSSFFFTSNRLSLQKTFDKHGKEKQLFFFLRKNQELSQHLNFSLSNHTILVLQHWNGKTNEKEWEAKKKEKEKKILEKRKSRNEIKKKVVILHDVYLHTS